MVLYNAAGFVIKNFCGRVHDILLCIGILICFKRFSNLKCVKTKNTAFNSRIVDKEEQKMQ